MSGDLLREMTLRAGSAATVVSNGGSSSSSDPQPSSTTCVRVDSKRPSGFDTAPRPARAPGRMGVVMPVLYIETAAKGSRLTGSPAHWLNWLTGSLAHWPEFLIRNLAILASEPVGQLARRPDGQLAGVS